MLVDPLRLTGNHALISSGDALSSVNQIVQQQLNFSMSPNTGIVTTLKRPFAMTKGPGAVPFALVAKNPMPARTSAKTCSAGRRGLD